MKFVQKPSTLTSFVRKGAASAALLTISMFAAQGCHAQEGAPLSPDLARRLALVVRNKAQVPFYVDVKVDDRKPSKFPGYDEVRARFLVDGSAAQQLTFLLSKDEKTLAQFNTFEVPTDTRDSVSEGNRPPRGGNEKAPVRVVVFDDLQCPYCAKMHQQLFPAITQRYGDKVRIVYRDFPLSQHAWAVHAAVDANCLAAQSNPGYWELVDSIHDKLGDIGRDPLANTSQSKPDTPEAALARAKTELDRMTLDEGRKFKADHGKLQACITAQNDTAIKESIKQAEALQIDAAPLLFINGERIAGAVPVEYVWKAIDEALAAQGITPPPPVPLPKPSTQAGQ